jgi:dTDP-4-dehydrorhamnose reductase
MNRILVTGINGQVGQELQRTLTYLGEVIGIGRQIWDLAQPESIRQVIGEIKPNLIVNAAAYTAVDKAETETELAKTINAVAPTILAQEAQQLGATLIHLSTDYVFDGRKNTPYLEEDTTNPLGAYGLSKLAGEEGIQAVGGRHIILRTAWVYGTYGKVNFVKTMLRLGSQRDEIRVVADQIGSPTWAHDIAQTIAKIAQQLNPESEQNSLPTGIYNFTNSGVASWYDFAVAIFEEAKQLGYSLKIQRVVPIKTSEYPTPASRPAYSVLSTEKISKFVLGTYPPHWREALRQMLVELKSSYTS